MGFRERKGVAGSHSAPAARYPFPLEPVLGGGRIYQVTWVWNCIGPVSVIFHPALCAIDDMNAFFRTKYTSLHFHG